MIQTPDSDGHADEDAIELEIDGRTFEFIGLIADELGLDLQEVACEAMRLGLIAYFGKN
jgi:hypothetical protein